MDGISGEAQQLYDRMRLTPGSSRGILLEDALQASAELGFALTREIWDELASRTNKDRLLPVHLADFLTLYARRRQPGCVLNLWSSDGALAQRLAAALPDGRLAGIDPNAEASGVAQHFDTDGRVSWYLGRPVTVVDAVKRDLESVDLLVSLAPFGYGAESFEVENSGGTTISGRDEAGRVELLRYASILSGDAEAVLVTGTSILFGGKHRRLLDALASQGMWMKAALSLPAGSFAPATSIPALVVVFSRRKQDKVFMAQLPKSHQAQVQLLDNMESGRRGRSIEAGVLLAPDDLAPLETLIARSEVQRGLAATGVDIVPLAKIATAFNRPTDVDGHFTFEDVENAFFMPLVGFGPPRLDMPEKISREWVQVVLDPSVALRDYVVRWLSSPLGRRSREAGASGSTIPRTGIEAVKSLQVPKPSTEEQDTALSLEAQLAALAAEVQGLSETLWAKPRRTRDVARRVRRLAPDDDVSGWMESLPLPLATVGRAYYARQDVRERMDALFHFFEAMAEFHAAILLSGISCDPSFFSDSQEDLLGSAEDRQRYYQKASLGGWTTMCSRLSKELRRLLSRPDGDKTIGRDTVMEWFGRPEAEWMEMITNPALYVALDEAKRRRNDWKGHGGASSGAIDRDRLTELETLLSSVQSVVVDRWDEVALVSPVSMSLRGGTLETKVDLLVGTGMPFRQTKIVTTDPLDSEMLYVVHAEGPSSMRLLPLVRMMPSPPGTNVACYFYNRVEGDDLRYVSYYYEGDPEAVVSHNDASSSAVLQALGLSQ